MPGSPPSFSMAAIPRAAVAVSSLKERGRAEQPRRGAAELRSPGAGWALLAGLCQSVEHLAQVLEDPEMSLALMHDEACVGQLL